MHVAKEKLVFRAMVYPGDLLMLTSAIRDLHLAHPDRFLTDVDTTCEQIWHHNPFITSVDRVDTHRYLNVGYPEYSHREIRPEHLTTRYHRQIARLLGVAIPVTRPLPEIYLAETEKNADPAKSLGLHKPYWVIVGGGKYDTTTKWWNPVYYQEVVDKLDGKIDFVQCGSSADWHPALRGAVNMVGKTDIREFITLIHHADGVLCPVTFAMHLAAAIPTRDGLPRPCGGLVGGRETPSLIQYPNHTILHVLGRLDCCQDKGCWRYVCQETNVRQVSTSRCEKPVQVSPTLKLPLCMEMITASQVTSAILGYYPRGISALGNGTHNRGHGNSAKRFAYTHPRHLQEHYERAGGQNVYQRAIRNVRDFTELFERQAPVALLLVGNLVDNADQLTAFCENHNVDRVFGEYGWFPHYSTEHADPAGYAWNSSLCQMSFLRLTQSQRLRVLKARRQILSRPRGRLPESVRKPFVLWPLQLIADRVNRYDLNVRDWFELLLWTRQILPTAFQLVVKHHPVPVQQPRMQYVQCLPNTIVVENSAPLRPLIEESSGVIGCNSTVLLESRLVFDKPTWAYGRSWYTGHPEIVFPVRLSERLPNSELLGKTFDDPWLQDYRDWIFWQLLARQYSTEDARKNPKSFLRWIHRRTAQSFASLGEDAFHGDSQ
jgi:ADP-heptose:LPS heptosyltransferase